MLQNQGEEENLELRNFCWNNKKQKFQKDITWLIEPNSDTKWGKTRDHMVTQPTRKDINSRKAK